MSAGRMMKLDEAKKVRAAWEAARKQKIKGDALHEFICGRLNRDPRSDPSWWKRLLANQKSQIKNQK